jgi:simple sugar transport system permease protein
MTAPTTSGDTVTDDTIDDTADPTGLDTAGTDAPDTGTAASSGGGAGADEPVVMPDPPPSGPGLPERALRTGARWVLAIAAAFVIFGAFLLAKGSNPIDAYKAMWDAVAGDTNSFGEVLVQSAPFLLAALAVAVPARAGLFNIGGEGQLVLGAIGALFVANLLNDQFTPAVELPMMAIGGLIGGALWALVPALLKRYTFTSEAITSLLLNYVAALLLAYLVHGPWKDPGSLGFPQSRPLAIDEEFPIIFGSRVHAGIFISVIAAVVVWAILKYTPWGFRLRVVGGNAEAARRAGFKVGAITVSAMLFGGALAGLAGMIEVSGVEQQLRVGMMSGYGFIGFLASWLVRHDPLKVIGSAFLLGAVAVGGNGLKTAAHLSGAAVYILMAVLLLAILGWSQKKKAAA